jgi:hypothetical protein
MKLFITANIDIKEAIIHSDGAFEVLVKVDATGSSNVMFVGSNGRRQLTYEGWFDVRPKNKAWKEFFLHGNAKMTGCYAAQESVEQIVQQITSNVLSSIKALDGPSEIKTIEITAEREEI